MNKDNLRLDIRDSNQTDFKYMGTLCANNYGMIDIYFDDFRFTSIDGMVLSLKDGKCIAVLEKIEYRFVKD